LLSDVWSIIVALLLVAILAYRGYLDLMRSATKFVPMQCKTFVNDPTSRTSERRFPGSSHRNE
jgi:hypothetical protein